MMVPFDKLMANTDMQPADVRLLSRAIHQGDPDEKVTPEDATMLLLGDLLNKVGLQWPQVYALLNECSMQVRSYVKDALTAKNMNLNLFVVELIDNNFATWTNGDHVFNFIEIANVHALSSMPLLSLAISVSKLVFEYVQPLLI